MQESLGSLVLLGFLLFFSRGYNDRIEMTVSHRLSWENLVSSEVVQTWICLKDLPLRSSYLGPLYACKSSGRIVNLGVYLFLSLTFQGIVFSPSGLKAEILL